ncbi:hypothetical protein Tco_0296026 [Tanacetum coccineum]
MMPSTSQEEIPPPPPPPPSSQTPSQPTPHTVSTIKLPILKKGEYDIWAMKMEHYLAHTDYPIWEVIQNGNGPVSITTDTSGQIKVLPPRTAEEIVARERERKARTTLLMALPEDHLAKFHKMTDAKEMWDAIKSRFGGNDESKKMQKVFESDIKGSTASSSSSPQNVAFVSENTNSTNEVSTAYCVPNLSGQNTKFEQTSSYSLLANQSSCPQLDHEDLEQIDEYDLERMDLKFKGTQDNRRRDAWNSRNKDVSRAGQKEDSKALVIVDGEGGLSLGSAKKAYLGATSTMKRICDVAQAAVGSLWIKNQIVTNGTEALLLPTLFFLWLDKVSTASSKLVPLGKVCTALKMISPAQTSEVPIEHQPNPSPRPSPTNTIPASIPETSGDNLGGHSSRDKSLSGNEGDMTIQGVYDLCLSLCKQVSDQAKEIQALKA